MLRKEMCILTGLVYKSSVLQSKMAELAELKSKYVVLNGILLLAYLLSLKSLLKNIEILHDDIYAVKVI